MLALQSAPLHLRDQDKQERRFDQPLLFTSYLHHQTTNSSVSSLSVRHHNHHHHPRHHSYHHPSTPSSAIAAVAAAAAAALMPTPQQQPQSHHPATTNTTRQQLFYRECDLKQDLSIANAKVSTNNTVNTMPSSNVIQKNVVANNHLVAPSLTGTTWAPSPRLPGQNNDANNAAHLTPIHKIEARIAQMTVEDYAKEKIVLLLTGSFCPIHLHHTDMLEAAKTRIEQDLGQDSGAAMILGGFLSPSHDKYVATKLAESKILLDSQERLELCRLQTADSDWIDVDAWESSQGGFTAFHNVTSRLQRFLQDKCQTSLQNKMNALHQQLQQQQGQEWSFAAAGSGEQQMEEPKSYASSMVPQRPGSLSAPHQLQQQQSAGKRNPFNIRVVYLCGADFVMRTGARKLLNGVVVVDRPLGPPSSNRRSIILTRNGESISIPVSDLSGDDSSSSSSSSNDNSSDDDNDSTSTTKLTRKERVFKRLKEGYGSEWFDASRNNIWWLPSRSQTDPEDISSTKIRERLLNRESCKGLLHPAVAQRLLENKARQDAGQDVCQDAAL